MLQSPGFKQCAACAKPMLESYPHSSCLKCLGEAHIRDKCSICWGFRLHTQDRDIRLKALLMEAALRLASELSWLDSAASTVASVHSAPLAWCAPRHCSTSPAQRKQHKKCTERGYSLVSKGDQRDLRSEVRPFTGPLAIPAEVHNNL